MDKLRAMNLQQFDKDFENKYNILKEDFNGLNNQDWNNLIEDMLSNVYVKASEILQKELIYIIQIDATSSLSMSMTIILKKKLKELKQYLQTIEINKEYFQNFNNEGNLLAFAGEGDYSIKLINISDLQKNEIIAQLCGHNNDIWRLKFTKDSKNLISGSEDKTVRVWEINTKKEAFLLDIDSQVNGIAISSDDNLLAINSFDGKIRIQDFKSKELLFCETAHDNGTDIQFSSDSKMLLSGDQVGVIKLWNLQELNQGILILIREFQAAITFIWTALFSPCTKFIITFCNESSEIKILDTYNCEVVQLFKTQQTYNSRLISVAISKDLDIIAYGEDNNVAVLRNKL